MVNDSLFLYHLLEIALFFSLLNSNHIVTKTFSI